jgi:hypothetical protein
VTVEPVGFDYDVDVPEAMWGAAETAEEASEGVDVTLYSVDPPMLLRRGVMKGDRLRPEGSSGLLEFEYYEDLHDGHHLLRRVSGLQDGSPWEIHPWSFVSQLERVEGD